MSFLSARLLILATFLAVQYLLYRRVKAAILLRFKPERARTLLLLASGFFVAVNLPVLFFYRPLRSLLDLPQPASFVGWAIFAIWVIFSLLLFAGLFFYDASRELAKLFFSTQLDAERDSVIDQNSRRTFLHAASGLLVFAPAAMIGYGLLRERTDFQLERVQIPIKDLPPELAGMTICQITDIHFDSFFDPSEIERAVNMARATDSDLVFLTGDYLSNRAEYMTPCVELLSKLEGRHGAFAVLGNHEIYTRTENGFTREFKRRGIEVLRNRRIVLNIRGARLALLGVDYVRRGRGLLPRLVDGRPKEYPAILLSHQPNIFPAAALSGIDLTVSGHTHGGQITLELAGLRLAPSRAISPYVAGHYAIGDSSLYVSRGVGTVGPPVRINARPEITVLVLVPARGDIWNGDRS